MAIHQTIRIRVGRKFQLVLPKVLREGAGIEEGDVLEARALPSGDIVLTPVTADRRARLREAFRKHYAGLDPVEFQRSLRGEWPE